jgi:hypothetical protein
MKAKLIKKVEYSNDKEIYYSLIANDKCIGTTHNVFNKEMKDNNENVVFNKLSKQNCDEIFGVFDVEKLADDTFPIVKDGPYWMPSGSDFKKAYKQEGFVAGFSKAMELNKDKVFTLEDMKRAFSRGKDLTAEERFKFTEWEAFTKLVDSIQPTEIEVMIVMEEINGEINGGTYKVGKRYQPKLDSSGCLVLTKKI